MIRCKLMIHRQRRLMSYGFAAVLFCAVVAWIRRTPPSPARHTLMVGTDPSEAQGIQDRGGVFKRYTDGSPVDALEIIHENGYDYIRIRIMVDPSGEYGLFQDESYTLRMIRDAKRKYGLKVLLDFHYSHWWTDGQNQWSPDRWRNRTTQKTLPIRELADQVYEYTALVMHLLGEENVVPDAVQIGNEISAGMLWEETKLPKDWLKKGTIPQEWKNLQTLLKAGIDAVHDAVSSTTDRPLIVIHLDTGGDTTLTQRWIQTYLDLGGSCDVIGLSWYPMWHGSMKDLQNNIDNLSLQFPEKQVWVVETAYYYEGYCEKDDHDCFKKFPFPMTEDGQYDFLQALRRTLMKTKCRAVFYWGSHWSMPELWFHSHGESWEDAERRALFDKQGRALKGIRGLLDDLH